MADIKMRILEKYGIDITKKNLFKLYKIDSVEISEADLKAKFSQFREEKQKAITNVTFEKAKEKAQEDLNNVDKYEAILSDKKLRKELFDFYNNPTGGEKQEKRDVDSLELAREYFGLISQTKQVRKNDLDFFVKAFPEQRKNRKKITDMLAKEMKIYGLGNNTSDDESDTEEKEKSGPLIVNAFQEKTVLDVIRGENYLKKASADSSVLRDYPETAEGLYSFANMESASNIDELKNSIVEKRSIVITDIQEKQNGHSYDPLRDALNSLEKLCNQKDVIDNFDSFKTMVNYSAILPFIYEVYEMRPESFKNLYQIAEKRYEFKGENDFAVRYFKPVYSHFNIDASRISKILKNADEKTRKSKTYKKGQEKARKAAKVFPFAGKVIHWLTYWPVFIVYLLFEVAKAIFTNIGKLSVPIFFLVLILDNFFFPRMFPKIENLLYLRKLFEKGPNIEWYAYLYTVESDMHADMFTYTLVSIEMIIVMALIYILPALFAMKFVSAGSAYLAKSVDWMGYERSFGKIFTDLKNKSINQYKQCDNKAGKFISIKIKKIIINAVCGCLVVIVLAFAGQQIGKVNRQIKDARLEKQYEERKEEADKQKRIEKTVFKITADEANIRDGAGKSNKVIKTSKKGKKYHWTGESKTVDGTKWYEIYLNGSEGKTGWISSKVSTRIK